MPIVPATAAPNAMPSARMVESEEAVMLSSPGRATPMTRTVMCTWKMPMPMPTSGAQISTQAKCAPERRHQCQPDRPDHETDRPGYHHLALAAAVQPSRETPPQSTSRST